MKTLFFCVFFAPLLLQARQPTLHGVITILNSRFDKGKTEYVQDAEIREASGPGNTPVRSGPDGQFRLDIAGDPEKTPVFLKVSKAGYRVMNDARLQVLAGSQDTVRLLMATNQYLAAATQRYYDIAYTAAEQNLLRLYNGKKKALAALQGQAGADPAPIKSLQQDISGLQKYFENIDHLAGYFAAKYASLNADDTSPLFQDALRLFQSGGPDGALRLLQQSDLTARPEPGIKSGVKKGPKTAPAGPAAGTARKELLLILSFKADLHRLRIEWDSAEQCYGQLMRLDTADPGSHASFALFLLDQNRLAEARVHGEKCLSLVATQIDSAAQCLQLADVYQTLGQPAEQEPMILLGLALSERLAAIDPAQYDPYLPRACFYLGQFYRTAGRTTEAETLYLRAIDLDERLFATYPEWFVEPDLARDCAMLGILYTETNRLAEGETFLARSLERLERPARTDSIRFERLLAVTAAGLGWTYAAGHKTMEAEKMYGRAFEIYARLAQNAPPHFEPYLAETAGYLGEIYYKTQKLPEAEKMYLRALEIWERLAQDDPVRFGPSQAQTAVNLGHCYLVARKAPKAEKMYLRAVEIRERLAQDDPAQFEPELAATALVLGDLYFGLQKGPESEKMYLRGLDLYGRLAQGDSLRFEPGVALATSNLALLYYNLQKLPEAETLYLRAVDTWERLAARDPAQFEPELANTAYDLGLFYSELQKSPESEKMLLRALEIYERLAQRDLLQFDARLARTETDLGFLYRGLDNKPEAEKMLLRAVDIWERLAQNAPTLLEPERSRTWINLSALRKEQGRPAEAATLGARALVLRKNAALANQPNALDDFNYAYAYTADLRDSLAAERNYPAAIALQEVRAQCLDTLWELDFKLLRKAAEDYGNLSWQYLFNRQYAEAQQAAQKALDLDDSQHWAKTNLGHSFLLRSDLKKAKQVYREYMDQDGAKAKAMLLSDLDYLEAGGVRHGDIAKARKWLQEQQ